MAARHLYGAAAAAAAASESKFFRPSKPKDVYESMASELLKKKDVFEVVSEFPNERNADHPHPDANAFYRESRFHRRALADAPHAECTCKSECSGAMALYKCFSCAKYDPLRLGLYCANCFKKRHPWFRVEHRWVTIDRLEDVEAELARQAQRAEIDRNLDGVERLIADVRRTSETCDVIGVDPTGDDLVKASVRKLTEVDAHVSRLQRELAQAQRARELLQRGGAALAPDQFALVDYEGGGALVRPGSQGRELSTQELLKIDPAAARARAATLLQGCARRRAARERVRRTAQRRYQKVWSGGHARFYYVDLVQGVTSWVPPIASVTDGGGALFTPRSHYRRFVSRESAPSRSSTPGDDATDEAAARKAAAVDAAMRRAERASRPPMTAEGAATRIQAIFRRNRAMDESAVRADRRYDIIFDESSGNNYYFNRFTRKSTWQRPRLLRKRRAGRTRSYAGPSARASARTKARHRQSYASEDQDDDAASAHSSASHASG